MTYRAPADHRWHVAINQYTREHGHADAHFMYEADA